MKNSRRWLPYILGLVLTASAGAPAAALTPPSVPADLVVPAGHRLFLRGHALGTQNYTCTTYPTGPSGPPIGWAPYGPQATLFSENGVQIATHFLSPNPDEAGLPRPTWQHSRDSSAVWAKQSATSSDSSFVEPGAIPWLRLEVVGKRFGPKRGGRLASTSFLQRVNTSGGPAPSTGCVEEADIGKKALVPYAADYFFYRAIHPGAE
jgi:hypothetical protein